MSTRSAIARETDSGFTGVYHHWDGYPTGVGATLFELRNGHFAKDTSAMLKVLIDDHPAGWSTINGKDFTKTPGFVEQMNSKVPCTECRKDELKHLCQTYGPRDKSHKKGYPCGLSYGYHLGHQFSPDPALFAEAQSVPGCYCHGERAEEANEVTEANAAGMGCEYAYIFSADGRTMTIGSSYSQGGGKMIGMFGMGDEKATWRSVAEVDLDAPAPDWEKIQEGV